MTDPPHSPSSDARDLKGERRAETRVPVAWDGVLRAPSSGLDLACTIRDIGADGARLILKRPAPIAGVVELHIARNGEMLPARVIWAENGEIGLEFTKLAE